MFQEISSLHEKNALSQNYEWTNELIILELVSMNFLVGMGISIQTITQ